MGSIALRSGVCATVIRKIHPQGVLSREDSLTAQFHGQFTADGSNGASRGGLMTCIPLIGLLIGGCMQAGTAVSSSDAHFTARDRRELANPPYRTASISSTYQRQIVRYTRKEAPGSILVDTSGPFVYYVLPGGKAIRYGATVGEAGQDWSGLATVARKAEWPGWTPTPDEKRRLGPLPNYMPGGAANPMGSRALYLYSGGKDTLYRIHGTNQPEYIGHAISSGCIRITNEDAIDLYSRVEIGTIVVVLRHGDRSS
jgi:lipoprotein-anchoring transpeptidase ErfK/SrfK